MTIVEFKEAYDKYIAEVGATDKTADTDSIRDNFYHEYIDPYVIKYIPVEQKLRIANTLIDQVVGRDENNMVLIDEVVKKYSVDYTLFTSYFTYEIPEGMSEFEVLDIVYQTHLIDGSFYSFSYAERRLDDYWEMDEIIEKEFDNVLKENDISFVVSRLARQFKDAASVVVDKFGGLLNNAADHQDDFAKLFEALSMVSETEEANNAGEMVIEQIANASDDNDTVDID